MGPDSQPSVTDCLWSEWWQLFCHSSRILAGLERELEIRLGGGLL